MGDTSLPRSARFGVMAVVLLNTQIFVTWSRVFFNQIRSYRSFRTKWCLHLQGLSSAITDILPYPRRRVLRIYSIIRDLDWVPCQVS